MHIPKQYSAHCSYENYSNIHGMAPTRNGVINRPAISQSSLSKYQVHVDISQVCS